MFDATRSHAVVSVVSPLLFRRIVILVDSDVAEPTLLLFVHPQFLRTGGVVDCDLAEPTLVLFVRMFQNSAFVAYRMSAGLISLAQAVFAWSFVSDAFRFSL